MGRKRSLPKYPRKPHTSGQARIVLNGRTIYLGPFGTAESHQHYARVLAEFQVAGHSMEATPDPERSIKAAIALYWAHAEKHYSRPDGTQSQQIYKLRAALAPVRELYGDAPVRLFTAKALMAVRARMIDRGWCRDNVNQRIAQVLEAFAWLSRQEHIPSNIHYALLAVKPLKRGESEAYDSPGIEPVPEAIVEATLPFLRPQVAAMVRLQLLTGMRPGEVQIMRGRDVTVRTDGLWAYSPEKHKTQRLGHKREILLGPQAQEVLRPWLEQDPEVYLFRPMQGRRPRYYGRAYRDLIEYACTRAHVPYWHPNQLRHAAATRVRDQTDGLEVVQGMLGHRNAKTTERYARISPEKTAKAIAKLG